MKEIKPKFTKPGDPIVYARAGSFSLSRACILNPKLRSFIACKMKPSCMTEAMPKLILCYARHTWRKESGIDGEEDIRRFEQPYVRAVEGIELQKHLDVWEVPKGLPLIQTLRLHIVLNLCTYFDEEELVRKSRNFLGNQ